MGAVPGRCVRGQTGDPRSRGGVSAGMGVNYMKRTDLVNLVNMTPGALERVADFKTGAEFFGVVLLPVAGHWMVKLDYSYQIASYNVQSSSGTAEYTLVGHAPSAILQYVLTDQGLFNLKVGAGGGPHFGTLEERFLYIDDSFRASGWGAVLEFEGNTALGDDLFVHLSAGARTESFGSLENDFGKSPGGTASGGEVTLTGFGCFFRLGLSYYFF